MSDLSLTISKHLITHELQPAWSEFSLGAPFERGYFLYVSFILFCQNLKLLKCLEFKVTDVTEAASEKLLYLFKNHCLF